MPTSPQGFDSRIDRLRADMAGQARRVQALIEAAFDAAFAQSLPEAARIPMMDEEVDRVDLEIERTAVRLLADATMEGAALSPEQLRMVLTIVKVNNELERIADLGVRVGESAQLLPVQGGPLPDTFRVLSNSVIGILRDAGVSLEMADPEMAKVVLASEDAVEAFKRALASDIQQRVARGLMPVELALTLQDIASHAVAMADHCTNIAEQVLYTVTGTVMRHMQGRWEEFRLG